MPISMVDLEKDVRGFLMDDPRFNVLTRKEQFKSGSIKLAIRLMIDHFNSENWRSLYTHADFPDASLHIQIYGTIYHLMNMIAALQTRNHLPYNDSGTSVAEFAKSGEYLTLANHFLNLFAEKARALKSQLNWEMGWGGVSSEYSCHQGYYVHLN